MPGTISRPAPATKADADEAPRPSHGRGACSSRAELMTNSTDIPTRDGLGRAPRRRIAAQAPAPAGQCLALPSSAEGRIGPEMQVSDLRVAIFDGNYTHVRDGANQALNRLVGYL